MPPKVSTKSSSATSITLLPWHKEAIDVHRDMTGENASTLIRRALSALASQDPLWGRIYYNFEPSIESIQIAHAEAQELAAQVVGEVTASNADDLVIK